MAESVEKASEIVGETADGSEIDVEMATTCDTNDALNVPQKATLNECEMPPRASLFLMLYYSGIGLVNLVIILPTGQQYASGMGASDAEYGLTVGAVPLAALLGIALNQWMLKRLHMTLKHTLLILTAGSVAANLLYALDSLIQSEYLLLCSRCLIGIFNGFNLAPLYISLTVGTQRRAEVSFYASAAATLSLAVGPAMAAGLNFMMLNVFTSHSAAWNANTAPGYFMALIYVLCMGKLHMLFHDVPVHVTAPPKPALKGSQDRLSTGLPLIAACASAWYLCVAGMAMAGSEVYLVLMMQSHMRLSVTGSGLLAAVLYFSSGVANLIMGRYLIPLLKSDRTNLGFASFFACIGCLPLYAMSAGHVDNFGSGACVCITWVLTFAGMIRALANSLSSKLVAPHAKALMVTVGMVAQTIGRGVGPIYGAVVNDVAFASLTGGLFVSTLLVSIMTYSSMAHETAISQK